MEDERRYWVGFTLVKGIGAVRLRSLIDYFGDLPSAWQASREQLAQAGLGVKLAAAVEQARHSDLLSLTWEKIQSEHISVLTWDDLAYPPRLKAIQQPPPVLYLRGQLSEADQFAVGVVGTRRVTAYGRQVAQDLGAGLARQGVTVVSGLARGVDGYAHQAALDSGGRTLAVLGSGVDCIYPPEHRRLAENICQQGAIISDYPPGTQPEAMNFPPRNRIIAGLSQAVVVVEAGEKSGALITAAFSAEQGRDVFAVPGSVYAPQSKGANLLIKEGAHIYLDVASMLETLDLGQVSQKQAARRVLPSDPVEARLFGMLSREPLHVDEIRALAGMPIEQVSASLALMELKGMVRQVGGMRYVAAYEGQAEYITDD